jgi:hypothetical protein
MTQRAPPTLTEPLEIGKWWKNRRRILAVAVTLRPYQGKDLIDIREHFTDRDGRMRPSQRGVCLTVKQLPLLHHAVKKAMAKAIELGLIPDEGEGER